MRASNTTHARLYYDTCAPLHPPVYTRDQNDNATYSSTRWVPTVRHFLACKDVAGGSQRSRGESFSPIIWTHFLACEDVAAVRWRNHYFPCNKEALPCCDSGPSCQPLHVQSTSDGSHSLTTLTMPHREHQGGGRRRGLRRERHGAGEDTAVVAHAVGSMRVDWFGYRRRRITIAVGE